LTYGKASVGIVKVDLDVGRHHVRAGSFLCARGANVKITDPSGRGQARGSTNMKEGLSLIGAKIGEEVAEHETDG
jgi:hypothetical protein